MNEKSSKQMRTFEDKYKYNYTLYMCYKKRFHLFVQIIFTKKSNLRDYTIVM